MSTILSTPETPPSVGLSGILLWLVVSCLVVNTAQELFDAWYFHTLPQSIVSVALIALALVALLQLFFNYRAYFKAICSIHFSIAAIVAAIAATMLGTLVVQTNNQTVFFARYGLSAPVMTWLYLNDLFHSAWFVFLLAVLATGLIGSAVKRKAWRWRQLGFLLSHGGIVIVLIGGAVGLLFGDRGVINLQTGESTSKYDDGNGKITALPFQLKLDRFVVEKRESEFRLYVVDKYNDESRVADSFNATKPGVHPVSGFGQVEVLSFDAGKMETGLDDRASAADPSVKLRLHQQDGALNEVVLRGAGPTTVSLGGEGRELRFAKKSDDIANFVSTLTIEKAGRQVFSQSVRVNQPLNYQGYSFYQASYDPKNPRYSGILVVRDPGIGIVYLGLAIVFAGIMHILLLRPHSFLKEQETA